MNLKGGDDIISNVIRALLEMKTILFLPNSYIINNESKYSDYLSCIDSKTLLYLIKEYNVESSETVNLLFGGPIKNDAPQIPDASEQLLQNINIIKPTLENTSDYSYYKKFLEMNTKVQKLYKETQDLKKNMELYNKQLSQFQCIRGLDNMEHGFISNFILDCSKYSIKNVDWFRVILKLDTLDDEFEISVNTMYNQRGINLRYDLLKQYLDRLSNNIKLKKMFEERIIGCGKNPFSFWGNIDFSKLNDCNECHDECILYLNQNYKAFLMEPDPYIDVTTKLKILVFCEYRLFVLTKHITLEAIRLQKQRYTRVLNILKKLSNNSKNNIFMKNKLEEKKKQDNERMKELEKQQIELSNNINDLVKQRGFSGGAPEQPQPQPQSPKVEEKIVNESNYVYEDLIPNCDAITTDILNGKIQRHNFLYLSPNCNNEIINSLTNS